MTKTFKLWDQEARKIIEVEAKKVGREWRAFCPKHRDEKHPNLDINEEKGVYLCRACDWKGHLYNPTNKPIDKPKKELTLVNFKLMEERAEKYQGKIPRSIKEVRGLSNEVIEKYRLGYCTEHPNYPGHRDSVTIPVMKDGTICNIRYHSLDPKREKGAPKDLPYQAGLPFATWLYPEDQLEFGTLILTEGALDALCCVSQGLHAITVTCGVGTWKPEFTAYFEHKTIYIIFDCDEAGRKGAKKIAQELFGTAKEIRIVDLDPELDNGYDLTNWFAVDERTEEELLELVQKTPAYLKKRKAKKERGLWTLIPGLINLVQDEGIVKYLLKDGSSLKIKEEYKTDKEIFTPKQDLPIEFASKEILNIPTNLDYKKLLDEVILFIKSYLELPSERDYLYLALWVLHTYLIEKFDVTPLLYFHGVHVTGKTRAGETLAKISFKCERLTSPTEATLFRSASYFKNTLVIDEIRLWGSDANQDVQNLIKSRYKRGLKVSRINLNLKGEDQVEYFDVFALLIICTTEELTEVIESRCLLFSMQPNANPNVEKRIDEKWAQKLRNKLTVFRADKLDREFAEPERVARRRLNEILMPLYQTLLLTDPEREKKFKTTIKEIEKARAEEEGMSFEAEIVEQITECVTPGMQDFILTQDIRNLLNETRTQKGQVSDKMVANRMKRLGFKKQKDPGTGRMGFTIRPELLKKLQERFGISKEKRDNGKEKKGKKKDILQDG